MDQIDGTEWTGRELAAAVSAYRKMQELDAAGEKYVKLDFYRDLESRFGREATAYGRRMQNISAVLEKVGEPWLKGLVPASNVGRRVSSQLRGLLAPGGLPQYHAKIPAMRSWLIDVARSADKVTYGALMAAYNIDRFSLRSALSSLGHEAKRCGEPIITALVVNSGTGRCSVGLKNEFGIDDDDAERLALYAYWRRASNTLVTDLEPKEDGSLEQRASRFARQEVRPEQTAFRKRVYIAFGGRCVVSGCEVRSALDAAHIKGRSWRNGHNSARDGLLLRKDLHALYDAGLMRVDQGGVVTFSENSLAHYSSYQGVRVVLAT